MLVSGLVIAACLFFVSPLMVLVYVQVKNFCAGQTTNERFAHKSMVDDAESDMNSSMASVRPPKGIGGLNPHPCGESCTTMNNCFKMCCERSLKD